MIEIIGVHFISFPHSEQVPQFIIKGSKTGGGPPVLIPYHFNFACMIRLGHSNAWKLPILYRCSSEFH
jgi:hypothetical protein